MRLTAENKQRIRRRIANGAAALFRERGYDNVNLDHIMEAAGLTRGAFYAHYKSKTELLADVARNEHPILQMLKIREGQSPDALWEQMHQLFAEYLDPENLADIFEGCTLASLTGEITRSPDEVKKAFEQAWMDVSNELSRGQIIHDATALDSALILAVGAVTTAAACDDADNKKRILGAARSGFEALILKAKQPPQSDNL